MAKGMWDTCQQMGWRDDSDLAGLLTTLGQLCLDAEAEQGGSELAGGSAGAAAVWPAMRLKVAQFGKEMLTEMGRPVSLLTALSQHMWLNPDAPTLLLHSAWSGTPVPGHQLLLPPANWCPMFAFRTTQVLHVLGELLNWPLCVAGAVRAGAWDGRGYDDQHRAWPVRDPHNMNYNPTRWP